MMQNGQRWYQKAYQNPRTMGLHVPLHAESGALRNSDQAVSLAMWDAIGERSSHIEVGGVRVLAHFVSYGELWFQEGSRHPHSIRISDSLLTCLGLMFYQSVHRARSSPYRHRGVDLLEIKRPLHIRCLWSCSYSYLTYSVP